MSRKHYASVMAPQEVYEVAVCLRVLGEEAVGLLLDEAHVAAVPGGGGPQHVFPPQHQGGQTLPLQLTHHRQ